jgi:endonuclease/exonuclease/phosphatase family metal-dependent hydrolase
MVMFYVAVGLFGFMRVFGYFTEPLLNETEIHRVVAAPAQHAPYAPKPDDLKIITWNIERGQAYDAVLEALRDLNADVLLLQEVDRGCRRTKYRDVAAELARELGMNWASAGEFQEIGEGRDGQPAITGQAILSRFPIEDLEVIRFKAQDRWRGSINPVQPRRGGRIALKARTAGVLVYNTHIESGGNDSLGRLQMAEILAHYSRRPAASNPVVIGGDFNNGPVRRAPMFGHLGAADFRDALGEQSDRGPTSFGQTHPIDWLFVKNATAVNGRVVSAVLASDHFPVIAALEMRSSVALR